MTSGLLDEHRVRLVPSADLVVDDDDRSRKALREAHGMQPTGPKPFYAEGTVRAVEPISIVRARPGAHDLFFVHKVWWGGDPVYGKGGYDANGPMVARGEISFISATLRSPALRTRAGRFVGNMWLDGTDHRLLIRGVRGEI